MITWTPEPHTPRRSFDLYRAERRAQQFILVAGIWLVRSYVLTKYVALDGIRRIGGAK